MMRRIVLTGLMLTLAHGVFSQDSAGIRHALVVAIGDYAPGSGFRRINAGNDRMVITRLLRQQGFTDTTILSNGAAAKEAFTDAFGALCSRVKPGDIVYLHFSAHGQQIEDLDGDEADGLDEAIAMCDAQSSCTENYRGQKHLTDDELGRMIGKLRGRLGRKGDILVTIDACHSGSMTRGADTSILRGGYPPLAPARSGGEFDRKNPGRPTMGDRNELFGPDLRITGDNLSDVVIVSACEKDEVSSEYYYNRRFYGPLTWAFLNAILNNSRPDYSYARLFHDISSEMNGMFENYSTRQHPTIETAGAGAVDRVIFGGRPVGQKTYYRVDSAVSRDALRLDGGTLTGLFEGTRVKVCPGGTIDPARVNNDCTGGIVVRAGCLISEVLLDTPVDPAKAIDRWVFVTERKLGGFSLTLAMGSFTDDGLKRRTTAMVAGSGIAAITPENPSYIIEQQKNAPGLLVLRHARNRKIFRTRVRPADLESVLLTAARIQFLKQLKSSSPGMEMEITLTSAGKPAGQSQPGKDLLNCVHAGSDTAWLTIRNTGTREFCFNVLEIDPDDRLSVLLPSDEVSLAECCLDPGASFRKRYLFSEPCGMETLKVLASGKRFDLRNALDESQATRSVAGDLEKLFSRSVVMRGESSLPATENLLTGTILFEITKKP